MNESDNVFNALVRTNKLLEALVEETQRQNEIVLDNNKMLVQQNRLLSEIHRASQAKPPGGGMKEQLQAWQHRYPEVVTLCRQSAELLGNAQTEFVRRMAQDIIEEGDGMNDSEFMISEFCDRYGQRLMSLNGALQVLVTLGS